MLTEVLFRRRGMAPVACGLAALLLSMLIARRVLSATDEPRILKIAVDAEKLEFFFNPRSVRNVHLVELRVGRQEPVFNRRTTAWSGKIGADPISLERFERKRDRLFSRWQLIDAETGSALGRPHYVDDLARLSPPRNPLPWPKSIKGLQSIVDVDDAIELGIRQAAHNVLLSQVIDLSGRPPEAVWEVDGEKIPIRLDYIKQLDALFSKLTEAGVNITIILLNSVPNSADPNNPLIHPQTDLRRAPNRLGAFNLTDERGLLCYRAALEYLASRYSNPGGKHGVVSGYIIGNELQAHWWWYNLGRMPVEKVIEHYARALRVAHLAVRKIHPQIRVYVSMDHHWTSAPNDDRLKAIPGKELFDKLHAKIKSEGDFEWHVAFHPYPENLFNPRTWEDKQATFESETPKITFRNLEVLAKYLQRSELLYAGRARRIILSEQGFHTLDGPQGEKLQAAAFAYAYYRARHIDGIDALILHRHVDHAREGGLKLGIRTRQEGTITNPGRKKQLYEIFRAADGNEWRQAFEFAKPIIGINRWEELLPQSVK